MRSASNPGTRRWIARYAFIGVVFFGLALRILIVALPGNELNTPWSGGGDTAAYVMLADNLLEGRGYSYAGQPTAFRPPGYPLLLAGIKRIYAMHYVVAVRWLQFALGLTTVYLCVRGSARIFGEEAWQPGLAIGLLFPTLLFVTGEILTECVGVFLSAIFLYLLIGQLLRPRLATAAGLGLAAGLAALFRFNMAVLAFIGLWAVLRTEGTTPRWQRGALTLLLATLVVAPWIVRNWVVFGGQVLFSTHAGVNAAMGILGSQGRTQPGETEKVRQTLGWFPPQDLETNETSRGAMPAEPELNRQGWSVAEKLFEEKGWQLLPLSLAKLSYFWLSTDQVFSLYSFQLSQRLLRLTGVATYWFLLFLAVRGWLLLRKRHLKIAHMFLVYAIVSTVLHLPFVMNTRYRVPLIDSMLVVLAGGGWLTLKLRRREGVPTGPRSV